MVQECQLDTFLSCRASCKDNAAVSWCLQVPESGPIPPRLLRAYITLARRQQPTIPEDLTDYIAEHYVEARGQEAAELGERGAYITPRTLMSILRLSQVGGVLTLCCSTAC